MIDSECSLTVKGKIVLYAGLLDIPIRSFQVLVMCYVYQKASLSKPLPMHYVLFHRLFRGKSRCNIHYYIRPLVSKNLVQRHHNKLIGITKSAYGKLKQHDADFVEINDSFEC